MSISGEQTWADLNKCLYKIILFRCLAYVNATDRVWCFPRQNKGRVEKEIVPVRENRQVSDLALK